MKKLLLSTIAALSLSAVTAGSAHAVQMKLTYSGVVNQSLNFDVFNTFGTGGVLAGQSVSMSFYYNANPGDTFLYGPAPSPIHSTSLTINGKTFTTTEGQDGVGGFPSFGYFLRNDIYGVLASFVDVTYATVSAPVNRTAFYSTIYGNLLAPAVVFSPDLVTPFNVTGLNCAGCGTFVTLRSLPTGTDYFMGGFDINSAKLSAIPVPAALPLLATAIAGLGFVASRRRKTAENA